jgi:alginate O-acetyltransferase complex protein AlgI
MIFTELRFLLFFIGVLVVYWSLPWNLARKVFLLAASLFFYAVWDWRFLFLIVGSTLVDYVAGLMIDRSQGRARKVWMLVSLAVNLGALAIFKYFNFFAASLADLAHALGAELSVPTLTLVLPLGISFYTFEKLSYTIDIYRGNLRPTRSALDLLLFVCLFPRLVAGPIMRATDLLPQFESKRRWAAVNVRACVGLFLVGYLKKACISDTIAPAVDLYFANPSIYSAPAAITAVLLYAVQIYCDFSGYTDMARACAGLMGYEFLENFRWPYLARNITDFWRRWHISLSSWLRDYLYISLGGNRGSRLFTHRNLLLTMLLGGLWHGAAWVFVIWGGLHGIALIVHKEWSRRFPGPLPEARPSLVRRAVVTTLSTALTFYFVCLCWIFFRSPDLESAWTTCQAWVLLRSPGTATLSTNYLWLVAALVPMHVLAYKDRAMGWLERMPWWLAAVVLGGLAALCAGLTPAGMRPFIYFQF